MVGPRLARVGAAGRVWLELAREDGRPGDALEGRGADEAPARLGLDHPHEWPALIARRASSTAL